MEAKAREEARPHRVIKLRYVEKLKLNRKGHSATFKSVTRMRREAALAKDKTPAVGHYTPKYDLVQNQLSKTHTTWLEPREGSSIEPGIQNKTLTNA